MKYGIVGSRRRTDRSSVEWFVDQLHADDVVVSGGCRGVDTWAETRARERGLQTLIFAPAEVEVERVGFAAAAHHRNWHIAKACDILVAFVAPDHTGGTESTIKFAKSMQKPVILL